MTLLARRADGRALVGLADGDPVDGTAQFVPQSAVAPDRDGDRAALANPPDPGEATAAAAPASTIRFGPPLSSLGKLFGIGLNYADHAADLDAERPDAPASFFKPASAVAPTGGPVRLPDPELTGTPGATATNRETPFGRSSRASGPSAPTWSDARGSPAGARGEFAYRFEALAPPSTGSAAPLT